MGWGQEEACVTVTGQHKDPGGEGKLLYLYWINVNIPVMIFYYRLIGFYHQRTG